MCIEKNHSGNQYLLAKLERSDPSILYAAGRRIHSRVSLMRSVGRSGRHALLGVVAASCAISSPGLHHVLVLFDAVRGYQGAVIGVLVLLGGRPGQEVTADLDVVVGCGRIIG